MVICFSCMPNSNVVSMCDLLPDMETLFYIRQLLTAPVNLV